MKRQQAGVQHYEAGWVVRWRLIEATKHARASTMAALAAFVRACCDREGAPAVMPPLTDNPTALDMAIRDVTRHGHDLPEECDLVRAHSGAVVFWHAAEDMESGRILPDEIERVAARGGYRAACAFVAQLVAERSELTSMQILTYAQLTGPHVAGG